MKKVVEPRPCRQCKTVFTPAHPNGWVCGEACRRARANAGSSRWGKANLARRRETSQVWRETSQVWRETSQVWRETSQVWRETSQVWRDNNREHYRAGKRRMKAANIEHYRAKRREWYHAHKAEEREAYRRWQAANRAKRTAYMHEWERRIAAIRDGKARLAGADHGFLLIRARSGFWRADEAGRRIGVTETIVARFYCAEGEWSVLPPAVATEAQRRAALRLAMAEMRRGKLRQESASPKRARKYRRKEAA